MGGNEIRAVLEERGKGTYGHASFGRRGSRVTLQISGVYPAEIIASTLRMLGQGVKVCVEIGCMALDAGLIPYGEEIVAVAGTGRGVPILPV